MARNRIMRNRFIGYQFELARLFAPKKEGEYIMSKAETMRQCMTRQVYEELRERERMNAYKRDELDITYLIHIFYPLITATPVIVRDMGCSMHKPTDLLEREQFPYKEKECMEISIRVRLMPEQVESVKEMCAIVENKMTSFKTDFYLHDMRTFARELHHSPVLWIVGTSHTFAEVLDAKCEAERWLKNRDIASVSAMVYGEDNTWVGSALRVACNADDDFYHHDGTSLRKLSRDEFKAIHDRYVASAREIVKLGIERVA